MFLVLKYTFIKSLLRIFIYIYMCVCVCVCVCSVFCSYEMNIQSNLSNSKLKGPKKKKIQEFELGMLCSKYIIVKVPIKKLRIIHEFELYKFELDKFNCIYIRGDFFFSCFTSQRRRNAPPNALLALLRMPRDEDV